MSRACDVCGKRPRFGNTIQRRGLAKRKGGIGLHTTGISRRVFVPNLQRIRVQENGNTVRKNVCARCIKAGRVRKA